MRTRILALAHIKDGANNYQAASYLKVSRRIVNEWVKGFNDGGIDALKEKHTPIAHALYPLSNLKI